MKKKLGYCCDEFRIASQNNIYPVVKIPDPLDIPNSKEVCSFCGKRVSNYMMDKGFINEV